MADPRPSFLRGIFTGAIHQALVFPYPPSLDVRDPADLPGFHRGRPLQAGVMLPSGTPLAPRSSRRIP